GVGAHPGSWTKVTVCGKEARRKAVEAGMTRACVHPRPGTEADKFACEQPRPTAGGRDRGRAFALSAGRRVLPSVQGTRAGTRRRRRGMTSAAVFL
ncbi:MAG TPA: hypothetical protein VGC25_10875, partial [Alphaproteobacteria bacterium]